MIFWELMDFTSAFWDFWKTKKVNFHIALIFILICSVFCSLSGGKAHRKGTAELTHPPTTLRNPKPQE